jgi:tetratricopeptide (TPR) repeat protein
MEGIRFRLTCAVALLFTSAGTIALGNQVRFSSELAADGENAFQERNAGAEPGAPAPRADGEFESALKLFHLGQFAEAERQFARIAEARNATRSGEHCRYYLAECRFYQKKYLEAFESFQRLHAEYPATEYREHLVTREYQIARIWLARARRAVPAGKNSQVAGQFDEWPLIADSRQLALRAFEAVRFNDPSGPLAEDAALQIAEHHMGIHDYESAAIYYALIISEYPKSPSHRRARLGVIDARIRHFLASYRDTPWLKMATELGKPMLRSFVDFGDR